MVDFPGIVSRTEALRGWPVEETTWEAVWTKNRLLPYLGHLGRFSHVLMLTESSLELDPLGSLGQMPYGGDSPFLRMSVSRFHPWGLNLWLARTGTEV